APQDVPLISRGEPAEGSYDGRGADGPPGEADECSHARLLPDHCVDRARAASTGAALVAGSSLLGDRQDARSHHRAPGLQPGGGASRLHRLPAIPDAQLAAAGSVASASAHDSTAAL